MIEALLLCLIAYLAIDCQLRYRANALSARDFEFHFSLGHVKPKYCQTHMKLFRTKQCTDCQDKL